MGIGNAWPTLPRSPRWPPGIGKVLACLTLPLALLVGPDALAQGRGSNPTGTQGIEGNPNCPPPVIGGITPKNWSCPTGTQNPFQQQSPVLQGTVAHEETGEGDFLRGAAKGFAECADGLVRAIGNTLVAAGQMLMLDFIGAEQTLGLERGRGTILRTIAHEVSQDAINATPEETGERLARRICQYLLIPQAARAAHVGATPASPVRGTAINSSWKGLEGKWVEIGEQGQVVQLGRLKGNGAYGAVYENAGVAGEVIKILNPAQDMAAAVTRQVQGFFHVLQTGRVPVPRIWNYRLGHNGQPAFIVMEDVNRMFGNRQPRWFDSGNAMTAADLEATRLLHEELGAEGYLWADANPGNLFTVTLEDGSTIAGIADADFIFPAADLAQQPAGLLQNVRILLDPIEPMAQPWNPATDPVMGRLLRNPAGIDARALMSQFYQTRRAYGDYGPPP
jgi:hypothetical protein